MTFKRVRLFWNGRSGDFHPVNIVKSVCLECCLISSHAFVCFPHPQSSATPKLAWQGTGKSSPTHTRSQGRLGQEEGKNELNTLERSCTSERFSDEFDPAPTREPWAFGTTEPNRTKSSVLRFFGSQESPYQSVLPKNQYWRSSASASSVRFRFRTELTDQLRLPKNQRLGRPRRTLGGDAVPREVGRRRGAPGLRVSGRREFGSSGSSVNRGEEPN